MTTLFDTNADLEIRLFTEFLAWTMNQPPEWCPARWSYDGTDQRMRDIIDTDLLTLASGGTIPVTFTELSNRRA